MESRTLDAHQLPQIIDINSHMEQYLSTAQALDIVASSKTPHTLQKTVAAHGVVQLQQLRRLVWLEMELAYLMACTSI